MTYVRVRGFKIFKDRHGKQRCYHRASGTPVDLEKHPIGTAGFIAECGRIAAKASAGEATQPGTLGLLIKRYRAHAAYTSLAVRTRNDYERVFRYLAPINDLKLVQINTPRVIQIRDKANIAKGWHFGNMVRTVLRLVFTWGRERGYLKDNPAMGVKSLKRPKGAREANRPWQDFERIAVMDELPPHMRLPIALMMYCGLDPQDTLNLPRTAILGTQISTRRGKTDEPVWLPMIEQLRAEISAAPIHDAVTLCANSFGRPWTVSGFRASWRPIRERLEKSGQVNPGLTLKGLRHTVATILAESGHGPEIIREYLGQKTDAMARHYSRRADVARKLGNPIIDFEQELNRRGTKIVKPK